MPGRAPVAPGPAARRCRGSVGLLPVVRRPGRLDPTALGIPAYLSGLPGDGGDAIGEGVVLDREVLFGGREQRYEVGGVVAGECLVKLVETGLRVGAKVRQRADL